MRKNIDTLVSVIIPCRNGSDYLPEAVGGVKKQDICVELIVINDGSTDETALVAEKLGCIVKNIPHSGLSAARNAGLKIAQGNLVLFHDHDDVMRPGALQKLVESLEPNGIAMAQAKDFISLELDEEDKKVLAVRPEPYWGLLSGAVLFDRDVFQKIGLFTENLATGQTMDILMRAESVGVSIKRLDFIAVDRRLHCNNMGRTMKVQEHKDYASILRNKLLNRPR